MTKEDLKVKIEQAKAKIEKRAYDAMDWMANNPELTLGAGALTGKILWELGRNAKRKQADRQERERRSRIWDPTIGANWQLKRELSNKELAELKNRIELGESRYDVLSDMRVLKK